MFEAIRKIAMKMGACYGKRCPPLWLHMVASKDEDVKFGIPAASLRKEHF